MLRKLLLGALCVGTTVAWGHAVGDGSPCRSTLSAMAGGANVYHVTARVTVGGAFTDRILEDGTDLYHGYGTAVIPGEGSFPVEVTKE